MQHRLLLQRRLHLLQHVFNHIFGSYTLQDRRNGFQIAAVLHASFVFRTGDGYAMGIYFASSEGD